MEQKCSQLKCCGLYALGTGLFLMAQSSIVSGSRLHLSYTTRITLCILAILSIAFGAAIWEPKRRRSAAVKLLLAAAPIFMILSLGFEDNRIAALPFRSMN